MSSKPKNVEEKNRLKQEEQEEKKRLKQEEQERVEREIMMMIKEAENGFKEVKIKKQNLQEDFSKSIKTILGLWGKKIKNEKVIDELYLATARMIEFALGEKETLNFYDNLNDDDLCELTKFCYMTYDRFTKKLNCLNLKPAKIYNMHHNILTKGGVGIVSRAMFSIQK
jgi:hypothetical protein